MGERPCSPNDCILQQQYVKQGEKKAAVKKKKKKGRGWISGGEDGTEAAEVI